MIELDEDDPRYTEVIKNYEEKQKAKLIADLSEKNLDKDFVEINKDNLEKVDLSFNDKIHDINEEEKKKLDNENEAKKEANLIEDEEEEEIRLDNKPDNKKASFDKLYDDLFDKEVADKPVYSFEEEKLEDPLINIENNINGNDKYYIFKSLKSQLALKSAYQNVEKLTKIHNLVLNRLKKIDAPRFSEISIIGVGKNIDTRDIVNMSYIIALENPNITASEYAHIVGDMYLRFTTDYSEEKEYRDKYNEYLKNYLTDDKIKELTEFNANAEKLIVKDRKALEKTIEEKKAVLDPLMKNSENLSAEDKEKMKQLKSEVQALSKQYREQDLYITQTSVCKDLISKNLNIINCDEYNKFLTVDMGWKTKNLKDFEDEYNFPKYAETVRSDVEKLFDFTTGFYDKINNLNLESIKDCQQILVYLLQTQDKQTKRKEFEDYLKGKPSLARIKELDNEKLLDIGLESKMIRDAKKLNCDINALSITTIGLDDRIEDPLEQRAYDLSHTIYEKLAKNEDSIFKMPLDEDVYKYRRLMVKENKGTATKKELQELYKYLSAVSTYLQAINGLGTNRATTQDKLGIHSLDTYYINGKSLSNLREDAEKPGRDGKSILQKLEKKTGKYVGSQTYQARLLLEAFFNGDKVCHVGLTATDTKLEVKVRPVVADFNQRAFDESKPEPEGFIQWLKLKVGTTSKNIVKLQDDAWTMSKSDYAKMTNKIQNDVFQKLVAKRPKLVQIGGRHTLEEKSLQVQRQKLMENNMTAEQAREFMAEHRQGEYNDKDIKDDRKVSQSQSLR